MSTASEPSLSSRLIELAVRKEVSQEDLRRAASFTIDSVANILGARRTPTGRILAAWAGAEPMSASREAFALGGLSNVLETDALHKASIVHAGTVVVPAALAIGRRQQSSGRAVLEAIVRGCEVAFRIGMAVGPSHYKLYQNTATCGAFGAAFAGAFLLGLDQEKMVHALGTAGTRAGGLWEFLSSGGMSKQFHSGDAAASGVDAADLAALGFTGPRQILEGKGGFLRVLCPDAKPELMLAEPDAAWQLGNISIKPWPCCRHAHPAIDAAIGAGAQLENRQIQAVRIETYKVAVDMCDRPDPQNEHEAKFSLQHCVAVALAEAQIGFDSFDSAAVRKHAGLRARVQVAQTGHYSAAYPRSWGARVRVELADGGQIDIARPDALGDPEAPIAHDALLHKARLTMAHGGEPDPAATVAAWSRMLADGPIPALALAIDQ